jgi:hypothetical protein
MVEVLSVLALATKQMKQGRFSKCAITYTLPMAQRTIEKFTKKLLGESDLEAVLQRLDRLTQDEARMTVAQTLGVVHGLLGNMRVVMEGTQCFHDLLLILHQEPIPLDGKASTDSIRQDLGMRLMWNRTGIPGLTWVRSCPSPNVK